MPRRCHLRLYMRGRGEVLLRGWTPNGTHDPQRLAARTRGRTRIQLKDDVRATPAPSRIQRSVTISPAAGAKFRQELLHDRAEWHAADSTLPRAAGTTRRGPATPLGERFAPCLNDVDGPGHGGAGRGVGERGHHLVALYRRAESPLARPRGDLAALGDRRRRCSGRVRRRPSDRYRHGELRLLQPSRRRRVHLRKPLRPHRASRTGGVLLSPPTAPYVRSCHSLR